MIEATEIVASLGPLLRERRAGDVARFRRPAIDSRRCGRGDLFVALSGPERDGHSFVCDAISRGARGVLVRRLPEALPEEVAVFVVPDTLVALQRLAAGRRERRRVTLVGVTGSVGKTTTKEITAAVLERRGPVLKNEANYNNEIGVPLTLLELTHRHRRAVLEMAMRAPGEIATLCDIARPDVGVVTNVGHSHLETLGSLEAVAAAKGELVERLPANGVAVLNGDDQRVRAMTRLTQARTVLFGLSTDADVRATEIDSHGLEGVSFQLHWQRESVAVRSNLPGRHNVANTLAAAAVGLVEGMELEEVAEALEAARVPGRMRVVSGRGGCTILDDTYNASPDSMAAALEVLKELPGRRIAVLGDMKELGPSERAGHLEVGRHAAEAADVVHTVGELGGLIGEGAQEAGHGDTHVWPTKEPAGKALAADLWPDDVVLLKASRAMGLETLLEVLKE